MISNHDDDAGQEAEKNSAETSPAGRSDASNEERIKQLARVVCICKGINLGRVLRGMDGCETVSDVNRKVGTGSGGCKGERCGPRIKLLLKKKKEAEAKKP